MEKVVREGLAKACPWQRKTQREKLSLAISGFLDTRTANTMETASISTTFGLLEESLGKRASILEALLQIRE